VKIYNASARSLLGFAENDILNAIPETCLPPELAQMFRQKETNSTDGYQTEINFQRGEGDIKNLQLASVSIPDTSGNVSGEVVLIRDLTSFKRLEQELQRSERLAALGKMAAGVAHELRNPLSSIKGLAVLLQSHFPETGTDADSAELLVGEVERLNRSIGELLDYAKPAKLNKKNLILTDIIEKALSLVRIDAETFGIEIDHLNNNEIPQVYGDRDKLNQVFLNIFLNAIQAMSGGGRLTVRCAVVESLVTVTVRDNGCGIDAEDLPRVFDPYYTTKNDGTGLGLALSLKIVEEHGGRLTMTSNVGEYAEARIELPSV
jgi:two-component system sensor histidine kinase HydH